MIIDNATPVAIHYEYQAPIATCPCRVKDKKEKRPHLVLHLDLNKTIIATDKAANLDADQVILYSLACHTFDRWDETIKEPISYTEYIKFHEIPNPHHDKTVKRQQYERISHFLDYLEEHAHPAYEKTREKLFRAKEKLLSLTTTVFPSFYRLIDHLEKEKIPYTLVMRTFGSDGPSVANEINETLGRPFIKYSYRMKEGKIDTHHGLLEPHRFIANHRQHCLIRDDWKWWFSHGENAQYGKPFPIFEEREMLSIFFDDHAQVLLSKPEKNIVAATTERGRFIKPSDLIEDKLLYPVDTVEALLDEDYFIKKIEESFAYHQ